MQVMVGQTENATEDRKPKATERNRAVLDFSAEKITGRKTAHADAQRERDDEQTGVLLADVQPVAQIEHALENELADKRKVNIAEAGQPEHAILSHQLNLRDQVAEEVCPE